MSIRTNPTKAVPALLNGLRKNIEKTHQDVSSAEEIKKVKIKESIDRLINRFPAVKQWQDELLDQFLELDRRYRQNKGSDFDAVLEHLCGIEKFLGKLDAEPKSNHTDSGLGRSSGQNENCFPALSPLANRIIENADNRALKCLRVSYDFLDQLDGPNLKICLLFLAIFPENSVLKKRLLIYWWIGEGLVGNEEEGEKIFEQLLDLDLIIPYRTDKCPRVNKCQIYPWIRYLLIAVATGEKLLHFDDGRPCFDPTNSRRACLIADPKSRSEIETLRTIFNISEKYLSRDHEWLAKFKRLVVLQLGRWQASPTHHIEVVGESLLKGLGSQKHLKYLSLRGISRITELPRSIVELISLEILDLHACHNLEKLPDDISSLRKLTHLDVSECYLLESMPKGLDKLTSLQVLKGFITGNSMTTPIRVEHLRKLEKLERLSIHIGSEAVIQDKEFEKLKDLKRVKNLKISWGAARKEPLSFPPELTKLNLEGIPHDAMPEWLKPSKLKKLEKLYIKGGNLCSLDRGEPEGWNVKILLLKYTNKLQIDLTKVRKVFPSLEYVKKVRWNKEGNTFETSGEESTDFEWP